MNKKYLIVNSNSNEDCTIFYLLYIVLIFVIIFIIYKIIFSFSKRDGFSTVESTANLTLPVQNELTPEQVMNNLQIKNDELTNIKNSLQNKLQEQTNAIFMANNYIKVDSSSYNDELSFLLLDFSNIKLPEIDTSTKKMIDTQNELNIVIDEAKHMKNFYKPGEVVTENSTFGITKNNICYRHNGKPIQTTPAFTEQYPNCMVCTVESPNDVHNTHSWQHTKTNIDKVCLYNPTATSNSGIPNLDQCGKFCGISNFNKK